jgi:hypothetical protein
LVNLPLFIDGSVNNIKKELILPENFSKKSEIVLLLIYVAVCGRLVNIHNYIGIRNGSDMFI